MAATHPQASASLWQRLWLYQAERFPLGRTALLLAAFSASSISVSAHLAERPLPHLSIFAAAWLVAVIFFFQLRACDEYKDLEDDRAYRPERPIPSGLVSLRLILSIAALAVVPAIALTLTITPALLVPLALVWVWLGLMTAEFFMPAWLKARPFVYLVSHMAIMALIDLYLTGAEWVPHSLLPPAGMWAFLALSLINGCVLEIGRKTWAPESERPGVETYSALLGHDRAARLWLATCVVAWLLLLAVGAMVGSPLIVGGGSAVVLAAIATTVRTFMRKPTQAVQRRIDTLAGVWVLACYVLAGFAPFLPQVIAP
ncbi:UbiA family prenyltransferase [Devosia nitrariae]|uniref:UbiA family prenyltransferase n=1 Tax=Devosia nitrariae TaxID=2071872 RepID=UPI0024E0C39D|nr:UbiA family prenyltransferase [Devosia nitrariae]